MKFLELPIGQLFWLRGAACRKNGHLTYVPLDNAAMGEMTIDPDNEQYIVLTKEEAKKSIPAAAEASKPLPLPPRGVHMYSADTGEETAITKAPAQAPAPAAAPEAGHHLVATTTDLSAAIAEAVKTAVAEALAAERATVATKTKKGKKS